VIRIDWDPIGHLGPLPINWYGLGWAAAFLAGWYLVRRWASAQSIAASIVDDVIVWIMVGSMAGARLYYVARKMSR
jgi:phosphatidylglycerol:prolipoprotein diacylglycerol transferase